MENLQRQLLKAFISERKHSAGNTAYTNSVYIDLTALLPLGVFFSVPEAVTKKRYLILDKHLNSPKTKKNRHYKIKWVARLFYKREGGTECGRLPDKKKKLKEE